MLYKLKKVGEFCSVIFVLFCFVRFCYGALNMRLSALRKLIFGLHGVQQMFFRLAKKKKFG